MKAVIPAAGLGTRMLPVTKTQPKEMLPLLNKPAIHYVVEEAINSGCEDILIITGRTKRAIEDYFDRSPELEEFLKKKGKEKELEEIRRISDMANIMYIRQKEPLGLGHAVLLAERFVGDEPFAVLLGDDIIINSVPTTKKMMELYSAEGAPVVAVMQVPYSETSKYGVIKPSTLSRPPLYVIDELVEKPAPEEAPSNLAVVGRYLLTPEIFTYLKNTARGRGGEYQLTDALKLFAFSRRLLALEIEGTRLDIGSPESWLKANIFMGKQKGLL
ncbi:MAG: UTP--glucose-1-phosphate uridylyltransferase GalU [Euryarchaeota archaeon]|nr:UTP--glucose-1-phosphate uridylyltransferase GalU [Euryarchaeota archaeon]